MHYIRLLSDPSMLVNGNGMSARLVFTITTDLGESFLCPQEPLDLAITANVFSPSGNSSCLLTEKGSLQWKYGDRAIKRLVNFPEIIQRAITYDDAVELCISPMSALSGHDAHNILTSSIKNATMETDGLIMPVSVLMNGPSVDLGISTRRIRLNTPSEPSQVLEIQEEIGESIARHIWDAGVVSLCAIVGAYKSPRLETSQHACMKELVNILNDKDGVNVLELGCGVGILGLGLCAVYPKGLGACTILMTDLREAEGRVRSNIGLWQKLHSGSDLGYAQVMYENLDWNNGMQGLFGRKFGDRRWDLIMLSDCTYNADVLPALVGTLSAIHRANMQGLAEDEKFSTKVFLSMKPRHADERAFFNLMAADGWETRQKQVLSLPVLCGESQSIEMYLFEMV